MMTYETNLPASCPTLPPQTGSFDPAPDWRHFELNPNQVCIVDLSGCSQWRSAWQNKRVHANSRYAVARLLEMSAVVTLFVFHSSSDASYVATQLIARTVVDRVSPPDFLRDSGSFIPYFGRKNAEIWDAGRPIAAELFLNQREVLKFAKELDKNLDTLIVRWS